MDRSVKVKELHPITSAALIIISDIHGNLNTFKKLLCRTGYDLNNDHLFLLGRSDGKRTGQSGYFKVYHGACST